jgi:hypothetical protein
MPKMENERDKEHFLTNFIPINRDLFDHHLWNEEREYSRFEAWVYLIKEARFEDSKVLDRGRLVEIKRGQVYASIRFLAEVFSWSRKRVETFIKLLENDKMIIRETHKETGQNVITLSNYDKYNMDKKENETHKETLTRHRKCDNEKKLQKNETHKETGKNVITLSNYDKYNMDKKENETHKETLTRHQRDTKETKSNKENKEIIYNSSSTNVLLSEAKKPHIENINYEQLVNWFNEITKGVFGYLRQPLSEKRKGHIRARVREYGKEALHEVVLKAASSNFLKGSNAKGWSAKFDWMILPTNFEKILSGNYDNNKASNRDTEFSEDFERNIAEGIARGRFERE